MAFLSLTTKNHEAIDITVFPKQYNTYQKILQVGAVVTIQGKKDNRSIIANQIKRII